MSIEIRVWGVENRGRCAGLNSRGPARIAMAPYRLGYRPLPLCHLARFKPQISQITQIVEPRIRTDLHGLMGW